MQLESGIVVCDKRCSQALFSQAKLIAHLLARLGDRHFKSTLTAAWQLPYSTAASLL